MKLGAAYNCWDCWELLPHSIKSIRKSVDWIGVVIQEKSNFWNELTSDQKEQRESILQLLVDTKQIDAIIQYEPQHELPHENEVAKRNLGLKHAEANGCTHFMTMDCDEIYLKWQFDFAKEYIDRHNILVSACQMRTYYKRFDTVISPNEDYYVPFIYKISTDKFKKGTKWPILADPTRKMPAKNVHCFERDMLEMHHLSYVRNDLRLKLENSSASPNFKSKIDFLVNKFEAFNPGDICYLAGSEPRIYKTITVENILERI
jgi:hypothetical protein